MAERQFEGQVVMLSGAAGGFGAEAARQFAKSGAMLLLCDQDEQRLEGLSEWLTENNVSFVADCFDITSEKVLIAHIEHGLAKFGKIDVAINNAGIGQALSPLHSLDVEHFDQVMLVNSRAVFVAMKHQLAHMVPRRSGVILNVASAAGLVGAGYLSAYAASKHAVVGLTKSAADEVARHGIRVNALCPSFAPTNLANQMADEIGAARGLDREAAYAHITSRIPMRRTARIDEVVQAMLWACDPANSFMTGQTISIDGGLTAV